MLKILKHLGYYFRIFTLIGVVIVISDCHSKNEELPQSFNSKLDTIQDLSQIIHHDSMNVHLILERARLYHQLKAFDECISDLNRAIRIVPERISVYHYLSEVYLEYYRSHEALQILKTAIDQAPDSLNTQLKLAELQLVLKQHDASLATLSTTIQKFPFSGEAHFLAGMNFKENGDTARAINSFQTAVEQKPELTDGWIELGNLIYFVDQSLSEKYFDNAIRIDSNNLLSWYAKAYYYQSIGKSPQALPIYKEILKRDSSYLDAYLNIGLIYLNLDSLSAADRHFRELSVRDTLDYRSYYYCGIIAMANEQPENAIQFLRHAASLSPGNERIEKAMAIINQ